MHLALQSGRENLIKIQLFILRSAAQDVILCGTHRKCKAQGAEHHYQNLKQSIDHFGGKILNQNLLDLPNQSDYYDCKVIT